MAFLLGHSHCLPDKYLRYVFTAWTNARCLMMELASNFVEASDEDPTVIIFSLLKSYLLTKKESRKLAYDILQNINCILKDIESTDQESSLRRLLNMDLSTRKRIGSGHERGGIYYLDNRVTPTRLVTG